MDRPARPARRVDRLALLAYPRSFRRDYGDEITRTIDDLRRHRGAHGWKLGVRIAADVATTAPRLRLESAMSRDRVLPVLVVTGIVAVIAAASIAFGTVAILLVPLVLVCAAIAIATRHDRPIATDPDRSNRWAASAVGGVACIVAGIVITEVGSGGGDASEASEALWVLWAVTTLAGLTMLAIAFVTAMNALARRRSAA